MATKREARHYTLDLVGSPVSEQIEIDAKHCKVKVKCNYFPNQHVEIERPIFSPKSERCAVSVQVSIVKNGNPNGVQPTREVIFHSDGLVERVGITGDVVRFRKHKHELNEATGIKMHVRAI